MRVTQFTQYNNFILNQQRTLSELNKVQMQISTGTKIQNMYDDAAVFTKHLKLTEEINSLTQVKSSATFAQTFANETDTVMNDFVSTLGTFKTNLLNAANATNDETSRNAIVSELKGLLEHLKDLANTSINGKYLFSGSRFDTKPIDDNFEYQGNSENVKAFLGAGVEREYNIDGASLFLGRDNDYSKHISTNVVQFDKMKANPEFVVRGNDGNLYIDKHIKEHGKNPDSEDVPKNEPVTGESQIRMLTGVEDEYNPATDKYNDGTSYFYIKGRKPNGETFNTKFSLSNSDSVNNLLKKIGEIYGNTAVSKVVDVSLNDMGQIQIKDIHSGKMLTDFYIVASDKDEASIEDLVKNGDYIVEFQKSDFNTIRDENTIKANNGYFDNRIFQFASDFKLVDGSRNALPNDDISDVLGSEGIIDGSDTQIGSVDFIRLSGSKTDGNAVDKTYKIGTDVKTMGDLLKKIENDFGNVTARLENGKIIVIDKSLENKNDTSKMSLTIQTYNDTDSDGIFNDSHDKLVNALRRSDFANEDKAFFNSNGKMQISNVSQVTRDGYRTVNIVDENGNIVDKKEEAIENPQSYATKDTRLADVAGYNKPEDLDGKEFVINFVDKHGNEKRAILTLRDTPYIDGSGNKHYSTFWVDENNDKVRQDGEVYDIFGNSADALTPANDQLKITNKLDPNTCEVCQKETLNKGMTYEQLNNVVSLLVSGEYKNIDNSDNETEFQTQQEAIKKAQSEINVRLDDKGRMVVEDNTNSVSSVRVAIFDKDTDNVSGNSPMLTFQSNNAITIDEPQVDFFETLQKAIDAVKNGNNYPDSEKNPRSFGIQGAIEAIDHVTDHVRRLHAKIGAVSNEFSLTIERSEMLTLNVQQLQSENIDTDIGEATMKLNSLQVSYQALLASIAKVNKLTLLNYL